MGLSPREVDDISLWQFAACADGYARSQGATGGGSLSAEDVDRMGAYIDQPPVWAN